ncbi:MAG: hypothetical protein HY887_05125 [Deltaproteobacteria bacterium]|nr:hypothetical protein [Deltaproteobacteria bacterium]
MGTSEKNNQMSVLQYLIPDQITSSESVDYNCIAWAAGDDKHWWEPDLMQIYYWPPKAPRLWTLDAVIKAYETIGFVVCKNGTLEAGFTKIALFVNAFTFPTHAARLLPTGRWTSKCGDKEDIEHDLIEVCGPPFNYGNIACYMKKPA